MDFDHHLTELSASSPCIPSGEDFHFYYKFREFRRPIEEIAKRTQSMLDRIGSAESIWGRGSAFPGDVDDAYEWLVNANEDVLELVDELVDELRRVKKEKGEECENGFEAKPKVPFHIPTIRKPQFVYDIVVNNANHLPFEHVLLEKSDDGQKFIHPLEKLSVLDFVDKENLENLVPVKPCPIECTPFKLVEEVKGLKELAAKLSSVNEFAVDLEHNQYRSFQGLTCLMQISTRTEDFVIDTLKVRNHVGPYLREVFKDPTKKKVFHGADRDIVWLQRDFGIYVCNMFDTGQASRVLKLERYSLQYLLQHFCGVTANKEYAVLNFWNYRLLPVYQNADWRLRPLPDVMLRYGREDTHYLLYIYDLMRIKLFTLSKESEGSDNPLLE
ncbi:Protein RRP6-like 2, partial [Mucuna pruriens]